MDLRCCFSFQDTSRTQHTYPPISRVGKGVVSSLPLSSLAYSSKDSKSCGYPFQWKPVIPCRRIFWFTFFIFNSSVNSLSFESLIFPIQHSACHDTADYHSTPSRQKAQTSCRFIQEWISLLVECGYHGYDDVEGRIDNGVDYEEAKNVGVSKETEGVMLGSRRSLNYVCAVAVAAYERNDWTAKCRWHNAAIIDNCSQGLRKDSE